MNNQEAITKLEWLYREFMESGNMNSNGMCNVIRNNIGLDFIHHFKDIFGGFNSRRVAYWGSLPTWRKNKSIKELYGFSPLRQTLLLLFIEWIKTDYNE